LDSGDEHIIHYNSSASSMLELRGRNRRCAFLPRVREDPTAAAWR
jgi:hypothetical protein